MTPHPHQETYPESVYAFGEWLKAHPCVKRVQLDADTYERYVAQLVIESRVFPGSVDGGFDTGIITWRSRAAGIVDRAWAHRKSLWPARAYRPTPGL